MKKLDETECEIVFGGGLMYEIGYEIGSGLAGEWGRGLGSWLYDVTH